MAETQYGLFKDLEFLFLFMFLILNATLTKVAPQQRLFKKPRVFAFFFFLNTIKNWKPQSSETTA